MADGYEAEVTEYTERGFKIKGEPGRFSHPRLGYYSTGEEEIFTDTPEYRLGLWGFTIIEHNYSI